MTDSFVSLHSLTPLDLKQLSRQQKRQLLQRHRESHTRNANVVFLLGTDLLAGGTSGISEVELSSIYEQILIAALDCGRVDTARHYLSLLQKRFGKQSVRVRHLEGLCLEAEGATSAAEQLYRGILKDSPTDDFPVKRLSAIFKSDGQLKKAIEVLEQQLVYTDENEEKHKYLEVHCGDSVPAYRELSNLYYLCEDTQKALYYADEAMLFTANSYLSHTRIAELCYMSGDYNRSLIEYAQSLRLNDHANNSRAAYGLWVTANEVVKQAKAAPRRVGGEHSVDEAIELRSWAEKKLLQMYKGSPMLSAVEAMLQREA
ncbi:uncharacterized protein TM35_000202470 [Trypanosoma theileri]|uniref:ER membrane protein complex subunit 2 n=1 Tax=Trypanosoma theileri TaxID=67003 RepID=A0A1X0NTH4_9TRYP|nr:uncharacterized protein TM35_000202470 [Trypanosoma theileri]ORC87838.1 hypothetical protein TM35_000202470 [Trypanosoma theileri]